MVLRLICIDRSLENGPGHLVVGESYRIGRLSRCAFVLSDLSVSRKHADLFVQEASVVLKDLNSRNGTFLDGQPITKAEVQPGQLVRFGFAQFQLIAHDQPVRAEDELSEASTFLAFARPPLRSAELEQLSKAERRVFDQLLTPLGEKEIASAMGLSQHTVHNHIRAIYRKLEVKSRLELLARWRGKEQHP
ncbi:MAG: FHA domain-containing protein [Planctomycetes bacterium]|nr:FHA domain-containing protein [Planctomycetota bacterium]